MESSYLVARVRVAHGTVALLARGRGDGAGSPLAPGCWGRRASDPLGRERGVRPGHHAEIVGSGDLCRVYGTRWGRSPSRDGCGLDRGSEEDGGKGEDLRELHVNGRGGDGGNPGPISNKKNIKDGVKALGRKSAS